MACFPPLASDRCALLLTPAARCQGNKALSFPVLCRISAPISAVSTSTQKYLVIVTVSAKGYIRPARTGSQWFQKSDQSTAGASSRTGSWISGEACKSEQLQGSQEEIRLFFSVRKAEAVEGAAMGVK